MNIIILDTETTDLNRPFCYDCSWVIMDTETGALIEMKANVIEQIWHNLPLFESAYYKDKREKYITMMRRHHAIMNKWGYVMQDLRRDIKKYDVSAIYAYNSTFDEKVINYNCDWFKCVNPLDDTPIYDIWGYASTYITCNTDYKKFCEEHELFTDTGNYRGSAESVYQYLTDDSSFIEEHIGLFDSQIEAHILYKCISEYGADLNTEYPVTRILPRIIPHPFTIKIDNNIIYQGEYSKKYVRNDTYNFTTFRE